MRPFFYPLTISSILCIILGCTATEEDIARNSPDENFTLVVLISVDQLRDDLLDRYNPLFTGGLRQLLDHGHRFLNSTHDHASTTTAPGHATLAAGVHPKRHGIVGNSWSEFQNGKWHNVYSVEDAQTSIVGFPTMPGRSPANIYRDGLPDWISKANPKARVVSISRKDRSAIGLAGKTVGEVYWMAPTLGQFITSTFYHSEYPEWVNRFNEEVMPKIYGDTIWNSLVPEKYESLTRPDTSVYERRGAPSLFPYLASKEADLNDGSALNLWRYSTPFPDEAVLGFAQAAINELALGQLSAVDYLGISFSQTDQIGHIYGPLSREQLDNLLRLDDILGRLFQMLDETVGPKAWVAGFSADHGTLEIPELLAKSGIDAGRLGSEESDAFRQTVEEALSSSTKSDSLSWKMKSSLEALPFIEKAYTSTQLEIVQWLENIKIQPDSFATLFANSFSRDRAVGRAAQNGVYLRNLPNFLWTSYPSTHGSPYYYDRNVPIIFLGSRIEAGVSEERVATVDVAPTLARLAGIKIPEDLDGRALLVTPSH
tara:strand:- start:8391 stop:10016 length:1626 start_codon:yes stop_codon:yes gene_type:complete